MKKFWRWTTIFRGHFKRNLVNAYRRIKFIIEIIFRILWELIRALFKMTFFLLGLSWNSFERKFYRFKS